MPDAPDYYGIGTAASTFLTLAAAIGVLYTFLKWIWPPMMRGRRRLIAALDSLVGRDEIRDSITNEVISPPVLGMGVRMAHVEQNQADITKALSKLAETQAAQQRLHERVDDHAGRIAKLELAAVERIVTRAESTQAFSAIEAAINATPDVEGEAYEQPPER